MANDGREALAALAGESFDVALMDVQMPEMDGLAATAAIRQAERATGKHLPLIGLTAHAMKGDRERCLRGGMDGYLFQAYPVRELFEAVGRALRQTSGEQELLAWQDVRPRLPGAPGFDEAAALARVAGNRRFFREDIQLFLDDWPQTSGQFRASIVSGDAKALERLAHNFKAHVGAFSRAPRETAERLETLARSGDISTADEVVAGLEQEVEQLLPALRRWVGEQPRVSNARPVRTCGKNPLTPKSLSCR